VGNTSFRLRGTDATRINVNINGIPLNNAESQGVYWVNIVNLAAMSESVQIQRGAGSSNGGTSAFGGAISLQTLNPATEAYATADISRGSFNTNQTSIMMGSGLLKHGLAFDASYSKLSSDGFLRNGFCDHESFYFSAGKYGERSLLKFVTIIGKQHTGITWNGATREEIATDPTFNNAGAYIDEMGNNKYYDNETDNYWQQHFQIYYSYQLNNNWLFNTALNYTHGYGYYENYKADKKFGDYGFDNQMLITNGDTSILKRSDFVIRKLMNNSSYTENASLQYKTDRLTLSIGEMINYYDGDHYGNVIWCKQPSLSIDKDYEWYRNIGTKTDISAFAKVLDKYAPDAVIHCAAMTQVDDCESKQDLAYLINAVGSSNVAKCCAAGKIRLIAISTDYVFDGKSEKAYSESDLPTGGCNVYGESKLAGEEAVRKFCDNHVIARISWLYGAGGPSFVHTMMSLADGTRPMLKVVADQHGNPTSTNAVARALKGILLRPELRGVFHLTCEGETTWAGFAEEIFRIAGISQRIVPCTTDEFPRPAVRPKNSRLKKDALRVNGLPSMPDWKNALSSFMADEFGGRIGYGVSK
jgi:dTDP-4-dehydrorhamnose reductase